MSYISNPGLKKTDILSDNISFPGADIPLIYAAVDTEVAAIKLKTDNLPASPAPSTYLTGDAYVRLGAPVGASMSADITTIDTVVDTIKLKTDLIPAAPAQQAKIDASLYTSRLSPVDVTAATVDGTTYTITIQPPAGETWWVVILSAIEGAGNGGHCRISRRTAATRFGSVWKSYDTIEIRGGSVYTQLRIDNTTYLELEFIMVGGAGTYKYSYFGWKE